MELLLQQVLDGIASGSLYGAMALSIVLVYQASGIINFAQGEMAMISAYVTWQLQAWGLPLLVAIPVAVVIAFGAGALIERVLVRPFGSDRKNHLSLVIVTLGLMLAITSAAAWIWGYNTKAIEPVFGHGTVSVLGASMSRQSLGILISVAVLSGLLYLLYNRTRLGLAMRAAASNPESARLSGVKVDRMLMLGWGIAASLGAVVGALVAPLFFLQPNMMAAMLLYAMAAASLGGFDSPVGALVGGLIVGVTENLVGTYVSVIGNDFKLGVALLIIIAVLLVRPQGLFGRKVVARV